MLFIEYKCYLLSTNVPQLHILKIQPLVSLLYHRLETGICFAQFSMVFPRLSISA